jgi:hypothetical protein
MKYKAFGIELPLLAVSLCSYSQKRRTRSAFHTVDTGSNSKQDINPNGDALQSRLGTKLDYLVGFNWRTPRILRCSRLETILELPRDIFQVSHTAGASCPPPFGFLAPVIYVPKFVSLSNTMEKVGEFLEIIRHLVAKITYTF